MAEIDNAQLSNFCNEILRPLCDTLASIDQHLPGQLTVYANRDLGTIINDAGAGNLIADGSDVDGRTRRVGGDVYNMIAAMNSLVTFFEDPISGDPGAPTRREVIVGWQVNGLI